MLNFILFNILLFFIGLAGIFVIRKNLLIFLMAVEIILLSLNLNFIYISLYLDDFLGQLFSFLILVLAAAESAIGLTFLIIYYRLRQNSNIRYINILKK
jgi:NADH-quinone oxidoreductase subunit K